MSFPVTPAFSDLLPKARLKDVALIFAGTILLTVASQILIPLGFTPIPLSLGTFAVLLIGAGLGPIRGGLSVGIYLLVGICGFPVFAGHTAGVGSPSFGYALGYVLAAVIVGIVARKSADRKIMILGAAILGSIIIYGCGVPWLMMSAGLSIRDGLALGVTPFLIGDLIKVFAISVIGPAVRTRISR